jgi:hypothetical protein
MLATIINGVVELCPVTFFREKKTNITTSLPILVSGFDLFHKKGSSTVSNIQILNHYTSHD